VNSLSAFPVSGQYSCTFLSSAQDTSPLIAEMESMNWRARSGFHPLRANAVWYEFFCDPVLVPIEVFIGSPEEDFKRPFSRVLRIPVTSREERFYFWPLDVGSLDSKKSFLLPEGEYWLYAFAFNPAQGLDEISIPLDYRSRYEHHRFVFERSKQRG
jgi:hypothetical protein